MSTTTPPIAADNGTPYAHVSVLSPTGRPGDASVRLSTGHDLGGVQAVTYSLRVGELARCTIETVLTPAELTVLLRDVEVRVKLWESPLRSLWVYYTSAISGWWRWKVLRRLFRQHYATKDREAMNRIETALREDSP